MLGYRRGKLKGLRFSPGAGDLAVLEGGEVGVGLFDGFWVRLVLGVFGERPVDAGDGGVLSLALAGGDDQVGLDLFDGLAARYVSSCENHGAWAGRNHANSRWRTSHGPAVAAHTDGNLWIFHRGTGGGLYAAPTPPAATAPPIASPGAGTAAVGESEALPRDGFEVVNSALSDNCQVAEGLRCMKCGAVTTQARHDGRGWTLARLDLVADRHRCLPRVSDADDSTDSTLDQIQDCTCVEFCDDDPKSACGLAGRRHVHPASQGAGLGPCSVHPDAPGDV